MGLHVGYVERTETGYVGLEVHRAARVAAVAHGGQLLITSAAKALLGDRVVAEPLGVHRLKDFPILSRCSAPSSTAVEQRSFRRPARSKSGRRTFLRRHERLWAESVRSPR